MKTLTGNIKSGSPIIFLCAFAFYLVHLHPTLSIGDSSELVAAAFSMGIGHPPGYPTFSLVMQAFLWLIPFGSLAFRGNLVAAVFGGIGCLLVFIVTGKIVRKITRSQRTAIGCGLLAALALSLSGEYWYRSTIAEVYTLNVVLLLGSSLAIIAWIDSWESGNADQRFIYITSFILGLGSGNHHTISLVVPGIIVVMIKYIKSFTGPGEKHFDIREQQAILLKQVGFSLFILLAGASINLYLPLRSIQNPAMDWGNPQNLMNFANVITRREYLPSGIERESTLFLKQLAAFNPFAEFTAIGLILGGLGVYSLWNSYRIVAILLTSLFLLASYGLVFLVGSATSDQTLLRKFFLPSYAVMAVFIGVGGAMAMDLMGGVREVMRIVLISFCVLAMVIWQFSLGRIRNHNWDNYMSYDYGMNELDTLPEKGTYLSLGETKTFPLWYLQQVEKYREDVRVIVVYFLTRRWYMEETVRLVGTAHRPGDNLTYKQMLIAGILRSNPPGSVYSGFLNGDFLPSDIIPYSKGITFQLLSSKAEDGEPDVWEYYRHRGIGEIRPGMIEQEVFILKDYASSRYNAGIEYYIKGNNKKALAEFETAFSINKDDPDILNNLASLYAELGINLSKAEALARKAQRIYVDEKDKAMVRDTLNEISARKVNGSRE